MEFTTRHIKGHGRGKQLGFPTINMEIPLDFTLEEGVYASSIDIGGNTFMGALHYGPVPVFGQTDKSLEVFLLDAREDDMKDIDTSSIRVATVARLRDVQMFKSSDTLVSQIQQDVSRVRQIFAGKL